MLKVYCLCYLGVCLVATVIGMIGNDTISKRVGYLLGALMTFPVMYYIWLT